MDNYNASQIQVLEGLEAIRKRPGMYIGSTNVKGLHHLIWEVVDNSIDEFLAGYGEKIEISIEEDNSIKVRDYGRGIPIDIHPKKNIPAAELVLTTLHAGGKFDNDGYKFSGGLHGVGISVVNALSKELELKIYKNGYVHVQKYEKGNPITKLEKKEKTEETGTEIIFKADDEIFEIIKYNFKTLKQRLQESAFLNKNLTIVLTDNRNNNNETVEFSYEGGIKEFVEFLNKDKKTLFDDIIYMEGEFDNTYIELAFQYTEEYNQKLYSFANNINTAEGGYHLTGFKSGLTRTIKTFGEENNLINKKDPELTGFDIREGITAIISIKLPEPEFEGQTKSKLGNSYVRKLVEQLLRENLPNFLSYNPSVAKTIIEKALEVVRARKAYKKARELIKRKSKLKYTSLPGKLSDCSNQNPDECEIYIVEGDSAGGSAKQGRDRKFQAILPLRGKPQNTERKRISSILKNEEFKSIITVLGTGIGEEFNENKLRYGKVVIMTDADVDGEHIATLLLTFFYRYMPDLIKNGNLFLARPPLYKVSKNKGKKEKYLYTLDELETFFKRKKKELYTVQRYKGLGEMNPVQLWNTTMDPKTRKLQKIMIGDEIYTDQTISKLMGSKVVPRRDFIMENSQFATEIDV